MEKIQTCYDSEMFLRYFQLVKEINFSYKKFEWQLKFRGSHEVKKVLERTWGFDEKILS